MTTLEFLQNCKRTDEDIKAIGEHFSSMVEHDLYFRTYACKCQDCMYCESYDMSGYGDYMCTCDEQDVDDNRECSMGYCPNREIGKDFLKLLDREWTTREEP